MGKSKRKPYRRDAPAKDYQSAWLCSADAYRIFCGDGYRRLSDCPEVQMCARVYADMISSMTLHLMRNTERGDVRVINELSRKIDIEPNRYMTRKAWMYNIVYTMLLDGDGNQFTMPIYNADGYLEDLIPLLPSRCAVIDTPDGGYIVRCGEATFQPDQLLHFVLNPDPERPHMGAGFRAPLRDVVKGLRQASATKQALMESPAPSLIVKVDGLTEEFASPEGRRKLLNQYIDSSDNGRPWMIPSEAFAVEQVRPLTLSDLAIAENVELDKRVVAGIFSVPPYMVGVGSYNKDEHNNFIVTSLMSVSKIIEQELTRKTLYSPDLFWRFNPRSLYNYSLSELIGAGKELVDRMAMRRNELRDWVGLAPDPEMDELLALENYIPADRLGDQAKLAGGGEDNG